MLECRDERQMRALTGLSTAQFDHVLAIFTQVYHDQQQTVYEQGWPLGTRRRRPGGGAKGKLPTMADKLYFVLYYYIGLTQDAFEWWALGVADANSHLTSHV